MTTVTETLVELMRHPWHHVVRRWHWKNAVLSGLVRGSLFFAINFVDGQAMASRAALAEVLLRVPLVGWLAAVTQALHGAEPAWAATLVAIALLPALALVAEFVVHWIGGTPEFGPSMEASLALSTLATLFSLFAMRRGVMLVGAASRPLFDDLKQLPRLVLDFALALPRALAAVRKPTRRSM